MTDPLDHYHSLSPYYEHKEHREEKKEEKYPSSERNYNSLTFSQEPYESKDRGRHSLTSTPYYQSSSPPTSVTISVHLPTAISQEQLEKIAKIFSLNVSSEESCFEAVYQACRKRNWTELSSIKQELDVLTNPQGRTVLLQALYDGEIEVAKHLIDERIALHRCDPEKNSAFHYAARLRDKELLAKVWNHLSIDAPNQLGQTPLHIAVETGNRPAISDLLSNGAQINALGSFRLGEAFSARVTPLQLAVIRGDRDSIDILLHYHANSELQIPHIGNILHLAIHFHRFPILEYLLTQHFQSVKTLVESFSDQHMTPLMLAAFLGEGAAVILLKEKKANLEATDNQGRTAFHFAALGKQKNILDLLYYYGCKLSAEDQQGNRPIDLIKLSPDPESLSLANHLQNLSKQDQKLAKALPIYTLYPPENLVFKGGGPKGIAYVGAVRVLEQENALIDLKRVAGTSAGAINSTLLAMGYTSQDMQTILGETDTRSFLDHPFTKENLKKPFQDLSLSKVVSGLQSFLLSIINPVGTLVNTFQSLYRITGVCEGKTFRLWIEGYVQKKTGITHCTFKELRTLIEKGKPFKHLHVFVSNLSTTDVISLNSEDPQWDNVIISDAVRATMSIPGVFTPHILHIKDSQGNRLKASHLGTFVDGGMIRNYPIDAFDRRKYLPTAPQGEEGEFHVVNRRTLGFSLYSSQDKLTIPDKPVETIGDLLQGVVDIYLQAQDILRHQIYENQYRTIEIDNRGVSLLEFGLSKERQQLLIDSGTRATQKFYDAQKRVTQQDSLFIHARLFLEARGVIRLNRQNADFTGRVLQLETLEKLFLHPDNKELAVAILSGPPGLGKTETALAFANNHLSQFSLIWWIESETPERMAIAYKELARALQIYFQEQDPLEEIQSRVHHALERWEETKPYLLIFDNAETVLTLPQRGNGRIIITSRQSNLWGNKNILKMAPLTEKESVDLLKKVIKKPEKAGLIQVMVKRLGFLPLAIVQVGAYIAETPGMNLEKYLSILDQREDALFKMMQVKQNYPLSLAAAWQITQESLQKSCPEALEWLKISAYLDPDAIPDTWIEIFLEEREKDPTDRLLKKHEILRHLDDLTIIEYHAQEGTFSLHRLRQIILEASLSEQERVIVQQRTLVLLEKIGGVCDKDKVEDWKRLLVWEPHARQALKVNQEPSLEKASISMSLGIWERTMGRDFVALEYFKQALSMRKLLYQDKPNPDIAFSLNNLGIVWRDLGDNTQAKRFFEQALGMQKLLYQDKPHLDIALSLNNLGAVWSSLGDDTQAKRFHEQALGMQKLLYQDKPHPDIALSLNNLGVVWNNLGDYTQAKRFYEQALEMRKFLYQDKPHPDIARSINCLGAVWHGLGDDTQAKRFFEQALEMRKLLYQDKPHPVIARSLNRLGSVWSKLGDDTQAKRFFEQALEMQKRLYQDKPHPDIVWSLNNLGAVWKDLGNYTQAKRFHEQALEMQKLLYQNKPHPDIARSLNNLGLLWGDLGDYIQAKRFHEQALEMRKLLYQDKPNPDIAFSLNNLGIVWRDLGDNTQAKRFFEQAISMYIQVYGENHPNTVRTKNNLKDIQKSSCLIS